MASNPVLLGWFERLLAQHTVLPVDTDIARLAGMMRGAFAARSVARTRADMLIAATAHAHLLVLVTRNVRELRGLRSRAAEPVLRAMMYSY